VALIENLTVRDETGIGQGEPGSGDGEAAGEAELEAGGLNELGAESVETCRALVNPRGVEDSSKELGG